MSRRGMLPQSRTLTDMVLFDSCCGASIIYGFEFVTSPVASVTFVEQKELARKKSSYGIESWLPAAICAEPKPLCRGEPKQRFQ